MKKPTLGLRPRKIASHDRYIEVCEALCRFLEDQKKIPIEWISEYNDLIEILDGDLSNTYGLSDNYQ